MMKINPIGQFGTWLFGAIDEKYDSISSASKDLNLDRGTLYHHVLMQSKPDIKVLSKYSEHFSISVDDFIRIINEDWAENPLSTDRFNVYKLKKSARGKFGKMLAKRIMENERTIARASDVTTLSRNAIEGHIIMKNRPNLSTIKIYSRLLSVDPSELENIIDRDWRENKNE